MKLFKSTLAIVALFAIGSVGAKGLRKTGAITPVTQVTTRPITQVTTTPVINDKDLQTTLFKEVNGAMDHIKSYLEINTNYIMDALTKSTLTKKEKKFMAADLAGARSAGLNTIVEDANKKFNEAIGALR